MSLEVSPTSKSIPAASVAQVVKPIPYPSSVKKTHLAPSAPDEVGHHPNDNNIQSANAFSADSKEPNDAAASEEEIWAEAALVTDISQLWSSQKKKTSSLRRSREELDILKSKLAGQLYGYKRILAQTGRGGKWTSLLRDLGIPRATADRYVQRHERSLCPQPEKRLTEAFSGPTHDQIVGLINKLKPKLVGVLTTPDSIALFLTEMSTALNSTTVAS